MRIKIVSDGTCRGTKVIDEETGALLPYLYRIEWEVTAPDQPTARITLFRVPVEITAEATVSEVSPCP